MTAAPKLEEARETVARWMIENSFATGHGDTLDDLLAELTWQVASLRTRLETAEVLAEARREALLVMCAAIDSRQIDSPEIDGGHVNGIPPHKWHEEWVSRARTLTKEPNNVG